MSDLLAELHTSHLGFFRDSARRAKGDYDIIALRIHILLLQS